MPIRGPWDLGPNRGVNPGPSNGDLTGPGLHAPESWLTYETFYGLTEPPFSLSANPAFFYQSRSHAATFQDLQACIRRRERLSVLTGDIGTGKTTLCRTVLQHLDRKTFSAFVVDPFASREDLLKVLLMDFGVMSLEDLTSGRLKNASRTELSYLLYDFLATLVPLQAFAVVFIDEAQNLSLPLLEEIRIMSDADGRDRQLQIVLVGQLELKHKLKLPEMRQLDQRVSVRCHLEPLNCDAVAGYVAHRLAVAGGTPDRVSFSPEAIEAVYGASAGVPRVINRLCDRALHHAHLSRAARVDPSLIRAAIADVNDNLAGHQPTSDATGSGSFEVDGGEARHAREFAERVEVWLTSDLAAPAAAGTPADSTAAPAVAAGAEGRGHHRRPHPQTYVERVTDRTWRAIAAVALLAVVAGTLGVGVGALETLSTRVAEMPALPTLPPELALAAAPAFALSGVPEPLPADLPASSQYAIETALFESAQRAHRLAAALTAAGYRAYTTELNLVSGRAWQQVLIGPYATREAAEIDRSRLNQRGGHDDARVVEKR